MKNKVESTMPKMPVSVHIEEADNGFMVSCYKNEKEYKTVHETIEGAMASAKKMFGNKKIKRYTK